MSVDQAALVNNKKLFDLYATKLSEDDVNAFSEIAQKLASWLNNEKAYYDQARPEIVRLLMVAQSTLRRAVGGDPAIPFHVSQHASHPLIWSYIKLIEVVKQFAHLFVERELELHIRYLVDTVTAPPSILPPRAQNTQACVSWDQSSLQFSDQEQVNPPSIGSPTNQPSSSAAPITSSNPAPQVAFEHPTATNPIVASQKGTLQKIKRKRKRLDDLIEVDLKKFRETAATSQTPTVAVEPAKQEDSHDSDADKHTVGLSELSEVILPPNLSRKSSLSAQTMPLGRTEQPSVESKMAAGGEAAARNLTSQNSYSSMTQDRQGERNGSDVPRTTTQMTLDEAPPLKGNATDSVVMWEHGQEIQDVAKAAVPEAGEQVKADSKGEAPVMDNGAKVSEVVNITTAGGATQELVQEECRNLSGRNIDDEVPTRITIMEKIQELHTKLSSCVSRTPLDHKLKHSQAVENDESLSKEEFLASHEIRSLLRLDSERDETCAYIDATAGRPERSLIEVPKSLDSITNEESMAHRLFERIKVPVFVKGSRNPGRVSINVNIKPAVYLALSRWTKKSCHSASDINDAMCVTLGCYKATEAALVAIADNKEQSWKEFVSSHQSSWPQMGGLQLTMTGRQRYDLPLSPPIVVTPDGLLDISHLLVAGPNGFELHSRRDMSKYVFALAAHPPTPSQLVLHHEHCKKEQDWQNWKYFLSQPFNINPLPAFKR